MSERQPYEEHLNKQWQGLSLPNEDMAWADMKRRLEEDDDERGIVWWRRGCMVWGLLLLALLVAIWFIFEPRKWFTDRKNNPTDSIQEVERTQMSDESPSFQDSSIRIDNPTKVIEDSYSAREFQTNDSSRSDKRQSAIEVYKEQERLDLRVASPITSSRKQKKTNPDQKKVTTTTSLVVGSRKDQPEVNKDTIASSPLPIENTGQVITEPLKPDSINITDSTSLRAPKDSVKTNTPVSSPPAPVDTTPGKTYFFSAGIAMQQQIPIVGKDSTPYSVLGREVSFADYVPSVYLRYNKKDTWFIQLEFKYGAPQYSRPFVFVSKTILDSGSNTFITNSEKLVKTYYHQLPLTFNHYILKNWSVGGGIVWNRFASAVSEQTMTQRRAGSLFDSLISRSTGKSPSDSVFVKSYFQVVGESEYQWKRFSVGARYAFGLQPFIRFTLPGGVRREEKNQSLQVFLRYQLWKGKEKK